MPLPTNDASWSSSSLSWSRVCKQSWPICEIWGWGWYEKRELVQWKYPNFVKMFLAENRSFNFCEKHPYLHENHHPPFRSCEKKGSALGKVSSLVQDRCSLVTNVGLVEWIDASKVRSEVTGSPLKADDNASAPKIYEDLSATECCIWSWPNSELNDAFFGFLLPVAFRGAEFLTSSQHATALQMVWEPRHKR